MHNGQLGGPIGPLHDPATGQQLTANVTGTFTFQVQGDPGQYLAHIQAALLRATGAVLQQKLQQNQVAIPTIAQSLPYFVQEIIQQSGVQQMGAQVGQLQLAVQVQAPQGPQVYQGQLPPDPHTQMQNRMAEIAQERLDPRNYEYEAQVNIGGSSSRRAPTRASTRRASRTRSKRRPRPRSSGGASAAWSCSSS